MNLQSGDTPLVLLCPAWKKWGQAITVKPGTTILHSQADEVIPFADSAQLRTNSRLPAAALIDVGGDHRLADAASLGNMLNACEHAVDPDRLVEVTVYHLQMLVPPAQPTPASRDPLTVLAARPPSVRYYRFLYDAVGSDYHWLSRGVLSDADLAAILDDNRNEVHVLYLDGSPAGFAELDRAAGDHIELVQFGLLPEYLGRGLGKRFLQWTIDQAWSYRPRRLWLHTCTLDHPAALPTYRRAGFETFRQEQIWRLRDPDNGILGGLRPPALNRVPREGPAVDATEVGRSG